MMLSRTLLLVIATPVVLLHQDLPDPQVRLRPIDSSHIEVTTVAARRPLRVRYFGVVQITLRDSSGNERGTMTYSVLRSRALANGVTRVDTLFVPLSARPFITAEVSRLSFCGGPPSQVASGAAFDSSCEP